MVRRPDFRANDFPCNRDSADRADRDGQANVVDVENIHGCTPVVPRPSLFYPISLCVFLVLLLAVCASVFIVVAYPYPVAEYTFFFLLHIGHGLNLER